MIKSKYRVVATGIGVLAPNGIGKDAFWNATLNGISGIKELTLIDPAPYPCKIAGEIRDFHADEYLDFKVVKRTGRAVHLGMAATKFALKDAGISEQEVDKEIFELIMGIGCPSMDIIGNSYEAFLTRGPERVPPYTTLGGSIHSPASTVVNMFNLKSPSITLSTNCTAGMNAIGYGFESIRSGRLKMAITGGIDAPINKFTFASFCQAGMLTLFSGDPTKASRPFDKLRDGGILSEGAAVIILEELNHALMNKRTIYGEIIGFGSISDNSNGQDSNGNGALRGMIYVMDKALKDANVSPENIDYISAHAPSDPYLDKIETDSIKSYFGDLAYKIPLSSIKSTIGNPVAAAASLQVVASLLSLRDQRIPPTINYENPDPDCDLDYVPNIMRYNNINTILVNSRGLGGSFSALVLKKFKL